MAVSNGKGEQKTSFLIESEAATRARSWFQRTFGAMAESSERATIFGLVSSAFGSGVLALPWVFGELGLGMGLVLLSFGGWMSLLSQRLLVNASWATGVESFGGISVKMLGKWPSVGVDVCLFMQCIGATVSYFVFLSQIIPEMSQSLGGPEWLSSHETGGRNAILMIAIFPATPLSCLRTTAKLRYASMASTASLFLVAFLIMINMPFRITELLDQDESSTYTLGWWVMPHIKKWQTVPVAASISFFSFNCHCNLFGKYRELENPTPKRVDKVLSRAVGIETFVYIAVGLCGYLSLGGTCSVDVPDAGSPSCTPINILASPRFGGVFGTIARICMLVTLNVSIPMHVAGGRDLFEEWIRKFTGAAAPASGAGPQLSLATHLVFCLGFLYLAAFTAYMYPELKSILSILGGYCCATFMFTVPMAVTLVLCFGRQRIGADRVLNGAKQIGTFWGVTPLGSIMAAVACMVCITFGYTSASLSLATMLSHGEK
jgi:amino acid permease